MIFILISIIIFGFNFYLLLSNDKNLEEENKAFTESSIKVLIIVFFSIVTSVVISLQKEIEPSSNHGFIVYIFIPVFIGLIIFFVYLFSLTIYPKKKILFGIISVILNLVVGLICSMMEF